MFHVNSDEAEKVMVGGWVGQNGNHTKAISAPRWNHAVGDSLIISRWHPLEIWSIPIECAREGSFNHSIMAANWIEAAGAKERQSPLFFAGLARWKFAFVLNKAGLRPSLKCECASKDGVLIEQWAGVWGTEIVNCKKLCLDKKLVFG